MTAMLVTLCGWCAFCEVGTEYETLVEVLRASVEASCHRKLLACDSVGVLACYFVCQVGKHELPYRHCCVL
jgi:hypothetical protein